MSTISLRSSHATLTGLRATGSSDHARPGWEAWVSRVVDLALTWHERARQRRQLQTLSDPMLHDLGLGRADVEAEASKPFWRT